MKAFNARYSPKEWGGFPRSVVIGLACCLLCAVLALVMPAWVKFIAVPGALLSLGFTAYAIHLGDDWAFMNVIVRARHETGRVTAETWTVD